MTAYHWVYDYACVSWWAWWKIMTAYHWVYDYACVSWWAWWKVMTAHHWVYDCACVLRWAWWEVVAAHHQAHDYSCCHLQADCLKSGIISGPYTQLWEQVPLPYKNVQDYCAIAYTIWCKTTETANSRKEINVKKWMWRNKCEEINVKNTISFRWLQNTASIGAEVMWCRRLFQRRLPATGNT